MHSTSTSLSLCPSIERRYRETSLVRLAKCQLIWSQSSPNFGRNPEALDITDMERRSCLVDPTEKSFVKRHIFVRADNSSIGLRLIVGVSELAPADQLYPQFVPPSSRDPRGERSFPMSSSNLNCSVHTGFIHVETKREMRGAKYTSFSKLFHGP